MSTSTVAHPAAIMSFKYQRKIGKLSTINRKFSSVKLRAGGTHWMGYWRIVPSRLTAVEIIHRTGANHTNASPPWSAKIKSRCMRTELPTLPFEPGEAHPAHELTRQQHEYEQRWH